MTIRRNHFMEAWVRRRTSRAASTSTVRTWSTSARSVAASDGYLASVTGDASKDEGGARRSLLDLEEGGSAG